MKKVTFLTILMSLLVMGLYAQNVEITANTVNPLKVESTTGTNASYITFYNTTGYQGYTGSNLGDMDFGSSSGNTNSRVNLVVEESPVLTVTPDSNVGIGVYDPDAKLEVNGQIKITGGTPGVDKVLVSDANGLATWAAAPPPPPTTYTIGDFAQGGVVFWVSANGEHGKVVSIYDIGATPWSNITSTAIGATAYSNNNGAGNTVAIMMQSGHTSSAARHCADLGYGGYDDWYLPSINELYKVYLNKATINTTATANGGELFAYAYYWSSTESVSTAAWTKHLGDGDEVNLFKSSSYRVRAVRAF